MRGWAIGVGALWALGCGGLFGETAEDGAAVVDPVEVPPEPVPEIEEPPEAAPDWIDALIPKAIEWEIMPGTTADENPERPAQLRAFFEAHPEYRDDEALQAELADLACAFGVEDGHERRVNPPPATPLVVEVSTDDWRVMVAHAGGWCTSDDWSWFTNEVQEAVTAKGITWGYGDATNDVLIVKRGETELARQPLAGSGYTMLAAGKSAGETGHDMVDGVLGAAGGYFGVAFRE